MAGTEAQEAMPSGVVADGEEVLKFEPPELVIGLVSPLGAPTQRVIEALTSSLGTFSYATEIIKVSKLLQEYATRAGMQLGSLDEVAEHDRVRELMNLGDEICATHKNSATALALAVDEMIAARVQSQGGEGGLPLPRHAWIIDSLKRVGEVTALREIYGDHAIIVSIDEPKARRVETLFKKIKPTVPMMPDPQIRLRAEELLGRVS